MSMKQFNQDCHEIADVLERVVEYMQVVTAVVMISYGIICFM